MRNRKLYVLLLGLGILSVMSAPDRMLSAEDETNKPVNLLFIMTDQQRFDAMSCSGAPVLKTPNLDRLAREGVRFSNAYSNCPVCVPARAVILTGHSIESVGVRTNGEQNREDGPDLPTFDTVLLENGYHGEYHGKWHTPYKFALNYSRPVRWLNGKTPPPGCKAEISEAASFVEYIDRHVPLEPLEPGQHIANMYQRPYWPDPLDGAYGRSPEEVAAILRDKPLASSQRIGQAYTFGRLDIPAEHSRTAVTAKEGIAALERLHEAGGPFTLTISIGPPHPPLAVPEPYYSMHPAKAIPVPGSLADPRTDSPYPDRRTESDLAFRDPANAKRMIADYYGLVAEVDAWIGRILDRLDELELSENTLVVFTSDHGEMLCDHGMHSKGVFYEGSVHIPMLMRLPGDMPSGRVVDAPVSHLDLFPTILDYCKMDPLPSEGESLRSMIEGRPGENVKERIVVSQWASEGVPGFMVFDGRWKLMFGRSENAPSRDALYDLQTDPLELENRLAGLDENSTGSRVDEALSQAERLKSELIDWLTRINSPHRDGVAARPIIESDPAVRPSRDRPTQTLHTNSEDASGVRRPNVLFLFSDQHNAEAMGCAGHPIVRTPRLDQLAAEGVRFDRAYCQDAICVPSRTSLMTGLYPRTTGCLYNSNRPIDQEQYAPLQYVLRAAGYRTGCFGKRHLPNDYMSGGWDRTATVISPKQDPSDENYEEWIEQRGLLAAHLRDKQGSMQADMGCLISDVPPDDRLEAYVARKSIEFIRECDKDDAPFFCWAAFHGPHQPYTPPKRWADLYPVPSIPMPESWDQPVDDLPPEMQAWRRRKTPPWNLAKAAEQPDLYRRYAACYYAQCTEIDHYMGAILDELDELGLRDDTIVIYASDHGDFVGRHGMIEKCALGHNVYEETLRVPLIISWPDRFPTGVVRDDLVELVDVYPTLVDLLDLNRSADAPALAGRSLVPALKKGTPVGRDYAFSENWSQATVIGPRYKLGVWIETCSVPFYQRRDYRDAFPDMLFDREADPLEQVNLIGRPEYAEVEAELRAALDDWMDRTPDDGRTAWIEWAVGRSVER